MTNSAPDDPQGSTDRAFALPALKLTRVERRFLSAMVLPVVFIALVWAGGYGWLSYRTGLDRIETKLTDISHNYAGTLSTAIWDLDYEKVEALTATLLLFPEVASAVVEDERGQVIATAVRPSAAESILSTVTVPIVRTEGAKEESIGRLTVAAHGQAFFETLFRNLTIGIVLLVSSLLAVGCAMVVVNRRAILSPLNRLMGAIARARQGHLYETVEVNHNDEVTDVIRAYGDLMQILDEKDRSLAAHRDHLEDMIRERTHVIERQASELEEALRQEKRLSQMQREFVSMASHEFRTPLAIIDGNARRIARNHHKMAGDDVSGIVGKIRQAVARMVSLMESTLDAAKLEAGKIQVSPKVIDVRRLLAECCRSQDDLSASHRILFDGKALPDSMVADPDAVAQVFANLLSNAVKYSPDADRVEVRGWQQDEDVFFSFRDFGVGIDADDQDELFTRFFRAKTSIGIAGTGIGLNLVKLLVAEHGGGIDLTSAKGEGSTFTLRLPLYGPDVATQTDAPVPEDGRIRVSS